MSEAKHGYVYIVKPKHANVYKIGESDNIDRRMKQLSRKFNFELELVFQSDYVVDSFWSEQMVQMACRKYHLGGDWFALDDNSLAQIIGILVGMK